MGSKAGLAHKRRNGPTRKDSRLRDQGLSRREAARQLGIHNPTAEEWDSGIRRTRNRPPLSGWTEDRLHQWSDHSAAAGPAVSFPFPGLAALEKPLDPRFLSLEDRERIGDPVRGKSLRKIAQEMGRAASTISRELARNSHPRLGYRPYAAHRTATAARARPKDRQAADPRLRDYVKTNCSSAGPRNRSRQSWSRSSPMTGDAREPRDDLPGPVLPGPRRAQTRGHRPRCAPAGPAANPTAPASNAHPGSWTRWS